MPRRYRDWTAELLLQIAAANLPAPEREYRFAVDTLGREWRADLAWPERRLLVEIEGGVFSGGRHTTGVGYSGDTEKYNWANILGYSLLRFPTGEPIASGKAILMIRLALGEQLNEIEWALLNPPKKPRGRPRLRSGEVGLR